ncbi:hypothetical protein SUGI_0476830 [Cryptomeria japonica]|nr:hypothetical protein SUGI_0476830 [Cryptomeria japonica]
MKMKILRAFLLLCLVGKINAECPVNLDYVTEISWNTGDCLSIESQKELSICQTTLTSLLGVGLAQYLREKFMFELPDYASANACLTTFQQKLTLLGLQSNLVLRTLSNVSEFVSNPSLCAGIQSKQDWIDKMKGISMETDCKGDLSQNSACSTCHSSGELARIKLTAGIENITEETNRKCYYFVCLYAAGVVNEFGPKNIHTADCILRVPFVSKEISSRRRIWVYSISGAFVGILLLSCFVLCYWWWVRRNGGESAKHESFVGMNKSLLKAIVKPNTGAVWFDIEEIRAATGNFNGLNLIGEGGFGTVYKGVLSNGQQIAVKRFRSCASDGDSEFINEAEIINSIRHRNLVVLRGFCVSSDDTEGRQRPSMAEALKMLKGDSDIPEIPDRPSPLTHDASFSHEYDSFLSNLSLISIQR